MNLNKIHPYIRDNRELLLNEYSSGFYTVFSLAKKHKLNSNTLRLFFKRLDIPLVKYTKNHQKYKINQDFFEIIDTEEKAYILGFIAADGYVNTKRRALRISLCEKDVDILEKIRNCFESNHKIKFIRHRGFEGSFPQKYLHISNTKLINDLSLKGIGQNKTFTLEWPDEAILPDSLIKHYLRGYFDGDGGISSFSRKKTNYPTWSFSICVNEIFGLKLKEIVKREIDLDIFYNTQKSNKISICGGCGSNKTEIFLDWLYDDAKIYLDRKFNKYIELKEQRLTQRLIGVIR